MKVKECMCKQVDSIKPDASVSECAKIMGEKHIGCIPVCDDNNSVVGIVTDRDILLRAVACNKDTCNTKVSNIMSTKVFCCDCNSDINEAEKIMCQEQIRRIPIVENGKLTGIITLADLAINNSIPRQDVCNTVEKICECSSKNAE